MRRRFEAAGFFQKSVPFRPVRQQSGPGAHLRGHGFPFFLGRIALFAHGVIDDRMIKQYIRPESRRFII